MTNALEAYAAEQAGIEFVFDPIKENNLTDGSMDVIIDAGGSKDSRRTAIQSAKPGSVIVHVGLLDGVDGFDARRLTLQ